MTNIEMKKTGDSWMVREVYNISGITVWRTSYYNRFCRAVLNYIKLLMTAKKSK